MLRAEEAGLGLAPYGYDLQYLHYLAHYAAGEWDHAQEIADGFVIRVTSAAEARLSAMALFIDVARDRPGGGRAPDLAASRSSAGTGSPSTSPAACWPSTRYWQGDGDDRAGRGRGDDPRDARLGRAATAPAVIRPAAVGLCRAGRPGLAGPRGRRRRRVPRRRCEAARGLIEIAREGARLPAPPERSRSAWTGRGWLARAEAEWRRAQGDNDPAAWQAVVDAFGPAFVYETARSRWRLAEALAEAGRRDEAQRELLLAAEAAEQIGASAAARGAGRPGPPGPAGRPAGSRRAAGRGGAGPGGAAARDPLAGLTDREVEVLRLLAAGHSNKEIGAELFIAPKTASVHVSNILAKLGAASRTEAAAIAHAQGVGLPAQQKS